MIGMRSLCIWTELSNACHQLIVVKVEGPVTSSSAIKHKQRLFCYWKHDPAVLQYEFNSKDAHILEVTVEMGQCQRHDLNKFQVHLKMIIYVSSKYF